MLIRFKVENFMSYNKEQIFNMISDKGEKYSERILKGENSQDLLNFSVLYGANASGKSNLTKAISVSRAIITKGISNSNIQHYWCKLNEENKKKATKFEYDFIVDNRTYSYGFQLNLFNLEIISEWLLEIKEGKIEDVFYRFNQKTGINKAYFKNQELEMRVYLNDIKNTTNKLLLTEISEKNKTEEDFKILNSIYKWFKDKLQIIFPNSDTFPISKFFSEDGNTDTILEYLKYFQTGITNYGRNMLSQEEAKDLIPYKLLNQLVLDVKQNKNTPVKNADNMTLFSPKKMLRVTYLDDISEFTAEELQFYHSKDSKISFSLEEESDGTKRLIQLLGLLDAIDDDKVFIVDELDRSLHPLLVCQFIETFLSLSEQLKSKSQLFITSHQTTLLDLDLLRRDEIWFVKKNKDNSSALKRLTQFEEKRKKVSVKDDKGNVKYIYKEEIDRDLRNDYLLGRYGGIPEFKSLTYLNNRLNNTDSDEEV